MATTIAQVSAEQFEELVNRVKALEAKLEELSKPANTTQQEMTDDHARRILTGDLKEVKHNDAAKKLGLSYGQVYSCRLQYTFKHIHKEMKAAGIANPWAKE